MFQHGLLILDYRSQNVASLLKKIGSYLPLINQQISKTLYVSLDDVSPAKSQQQILNNNNNDNGLLTRKDLIYMVPSIYVEAHRRAPMLDVRVLHHNIWKYRSKNDPLSSKIEGNNKFKLFFTPEAIFSDNNFDIDFLIEYLTKKFYNNFSRNTFQFINLEQNDHQLQQQKEFNLESSISDQIFDNIVIGGTFDDLHNGHKILLSRAQLKCDKSLTIGVTDESMIKNKILWELIESPEKRCQSLNEYLNDVDPFIEYKITTISDPFGPAIVDENLQAIIVSEETVRGGEKINEIRRSKGMSELIIDIIKLLEDEHKTSDVEEKKVSSSSLRMRKLGTLLKEPEPKPNLDPKPYLIGLTGIICSGKSSIAKKLGQLGAGVVNVDQLAHKTYENKTSETYKEILNTFGKEILDEQTEQIDRKKLGQIVFNDKEKLNELNSIVWPAVFKLMFEEIDRLKSENYQIIILEIALLIESKIFMDFCHQIWLTILDDNEIIRRLKERNNLDEQQAMQRIKSQMSNKEKIPYANVVFCTKWEEEFTWKQIHRAWNMLHEKFI